MKFYDALYKIAKDVNVSIGQIGRQLGKNDGYVMNAKCRNSEPSTENAAKMLSTCGYALCAVKRDEVTGSMLEID